MKRFLLLLLLAAVLLAAAVAYLAPASLIVPEIERASHGRITLGEVDGTLWRGRGVLTAGAARLPFAWTLEALPLLTGKARAHVLPPAGGASSPHADITVADRKLVVTDLAVSVPAIILQQALTRIAAGRAAWTIDGQIAADTPRLEWSPAAYDGGLRVAWRNAHLTIVSKVEIDLGEATATLAAQGGRLAGPVANTGGNLDVRGDVSVGTDGSANLSLLLTPRRDDDAELARVLGAVGTREGAGWRVNWQTRPP